MLSEIQFEKFKKDYFLSWKIRRLIVRMYKECIKYDIEKHYPVAIDHEGWVINPGTSFTGKDYITIDAIKKSYYYNCDSIKNYITEIETLIKETSDVFQKNMTETLDARFPHVHWAYRAARRKIDNVDERNQFYLDNYITMSNMDERNRWTRMVFPKVYRRPWLSPTYVIQKAEEVLSLYGAEDTISRDEKLSIVFLTGSGISQESGIPTFRDTGGLWEEYPVDIVATANGWNTKPEFVNDFYTQLREKYYNSSIVPNEAHKLIKSVEGMSNNYEVTVITQNVDNLHEQAGSTNVIHLHGELNIMCSEHNVEDRKYWVDVLNSNTQFNNNTRVGEIFPDAPDNIKSSRMRPHIVFFGENVPNIGGAMWRVEKADVLIVIGTSLQVYPASSLLDYANFDIPVIYIDPNPAPTERNGVTVIPQTASAGMRTLIGNWKEYTKLKE